MTILQTVSIIMPNYNGALLIERCIDSVFNQEGNFNLEVIVIDDGSTDNSLEVLEDYNNEIIILKQANQGPAAARNKGIEKATGKYLAFLDADDYWEPSFLQETVSFLEKEMNAVAVSVGQNHKIIGNPDFISPHFLVSNLAKYKVAILLKNFYSFWAKHNHVCTGSVLMRTAIVKETGGQRTELRITEDLEFWAYLATFGNWGFIPKILFVSDGGLVTKETGWLEKNKKRWASAPTVEQWESRIANRVSKELLESFNKVKGRISKNLVYSMILSNRIDLARVLTLKHGKDFPLNKVSTFMNLASKKIYLWNLFSILIIFREKHRKI